MSKYVDIYRTYYKKRYNISKSARIIHNYLFSKQNSISKYGEKEALLLTRFFQEMKDYSIKTTDSAGTVIKKTLLGQEFDKIPILDFTKGGRSTGGIEFEQELEKLFNGSLQEENEKGFGQMTATTYVNLGTTNMEDAIQALSEYVNDEIDKKIKNVEKRIISGQDIGAAPPDALYLKIGGRRFGKIDVFANGAEISTEFQFKGEIKPNSKIAYALELLRNSSFSVKSYQTGGAIHLGNTNPKKAVSAVSEYVANKTGKEAPRYAGVYFLHHPETGGKNDNKDAIEELYKHYGHMKNVYELTGIGLRYNDIEELYSVDFLLVNRAGGNDIRVYSTQQLLKILNKNGKYNI